MKLNIDCIRDVMLAVESLEFEHGLFFDDLVSLLSQYSAAELQYTCGKLHEAKFLNSITYPVQNEIVPRTHELLDLTFSGHEFLEKVRDEKRWGLVKSAARSIRDYSLSALSSIAEGATSAAISAYFSRNKDHQEFSL